MIPPAKPWQFPHLGYELRLPRQPSLEDLVESLAAWEEVRPPTPKLPAMGLLCSSALDGSDPRLHLRVHEDSGENFAESAAAVASLFAKFIAPRLGGDDTPRRADRGTTGVKFRLNGTPRVEPGELVSAAVLSALCCADEVATWCPLRRGVKVYQVPQVGAERRRPELVALHTWIFEGDLRSTADALRMHEFALKSLFAANWRAYALDLFHPLDSAHPHGWDEEQGAWIWDRGE